MWADTKTKGEINTTQNCIITKCNDYTHACGQTQIEKINTAQTCLIIRLSLVLRPLRT